MSSLVTDHPSPGERKARGKAARGRAARSDHGDWGPEPGRADPIVLLEEQAAERVQSLVPLRYERMSASPFAFFRGGAALMSADLAGGPDSGLQTQLCGDAHLSNFGGFAGPDRRFLFDLNDFDETHEGPFEWDVKRLAASLAVAGREQGFSKKERRRIVAGSVQAYRETMRRLARMRHLASLVRAGRVRRGLQDDPATTGCQDPADRATQPGEGAGQGQHARPVQAHAGGRR